MLKDLVWVLSTLALWAAIIAEVSGAVSIRRDPWALAALGSILAAAYRLGVADTGGWGRRLFLVSALGITLCATLSVPKSTISLLRPLAALSVVTNLVAMFVCGPRARGRVDELALLLGGLVPIIFGTLVLMVEFHGTPNGLVGRPLQVLSVGLLFGASIPAATAMTLGAQRRAPVRYRVLAILSVVAIGGVVGHVLSFDIVIVSVLIAALYPVASLLLGPDGKQE